MQKFQGREVRVADETSKLNDEKCNDFEVKKKHDCWVF